MSVNFAFFDSLSGIFRQFAFLLINVDFTESVVMIKMLMSTASSDFVCLPKSDDVVPSSVCGANCNIVLVSACI